MKNKHFGVFVIVVVGFVVLVPLMRAQSISVFSHTTIESGHQAVAECGTTMNDAATSASYPSVSTYCSFFQFDTSLGNFSCVGNPKAVCRARFTTTPGQTYMTAGSHGFSMY